ncbi:MAG: DmsC/YnfH family molybdoenzyme membrane anchor subunit [Acidobacteriota bacterium]|nr:DmsC/YnfH family molybdoenzyme membrane anchor subunit [Acidobacteriota bacterium]
MVPRDWALVVFTVLTQAAVGAFLTLLILRNLTATAETPLRSCARWAHATVLAVLALGMVAALFHLSEPFEAVRAVVNVRSSWLSREVIFGGLFSLRLGALLLMEWRETRWSRVTHWLGWTAAATAVTFLVCQIKIYLLPAQPVWNSLATPLAFAGTALRLGVLGVAVGLVCCRVDETSREQKSVHSDGTTFATLRGLALLGLVGLVAELVVMALQLAPLADAMPAAALASARRLTEDYAGVLVTRLLLLVVAAACIVVVIVGKVSGQTHKLPAMTIVAFVVVLVSEVCGRFLFYASRVTVGI